MNARSFSRLLLGALLLLLVGCRPDSNTADPPADDSFARIYADPAEVRQESDAAPLTTVAFAAEVDQLARLAHAEGQSLTLQPAGSEALAWLAAQNVPASLRDFYAVNDPQFDVEADGVYLRPLANLREVNANTPLGQLLNRYGLLIVATTVSGDLYYLDARSLDSSGEAPIYLLNHERLGANATVVEIEDQSLLVAVSFRQFLALFLQAGLQYDVSVPAQPLRDPARRAFFTQYEDAAQRFVLRYPTAWFSPRSEDDAVAAHFVNRATVDAPGGTVVTVLEQRRAADLAVAARTVFEAVRDQAGVSEVEITSADAVLVNGRSGYEMVFAYTLRGARLVQRTVLVDGARQTYVVNMTTVQAQVETMFPLFDALVGSFHLMEGAG